MTSLTLLCLYFSLISSLMFATNPLVLGIWTLLLALMIAIFISFSLSSWYGMMIFLIYIGGLMVMFSYFTALIPNQQMNLGQMVEMTVTPFLTLFLLLSPNYSKSLLSLVPSSSLTNLYTYENIPLLLYFASLLFFTLIAVVKVSTKSKGPLRPFQKYV